MKVRTIILPYLHRADLLALGHAGKDNYPSLYRADLLALGCVGKDSYFSLHRECTDLRTCR